MISSILCSKYNIMLAKKTLLQFLTSDLDINACFKRPCKNKGVCIKIGSSYRCRCKYPYYGRNCQCKNHSYVFVFLLFKIQSKKLLSI